MDRLDRIEFDGHPPSRPGWLCERCDAPWPCEFERVRLRELYGDDKLGLATYLSGQLVIAARETGGPPARLHERFVAWTR